MGHYIDGFAFPVSREHLADYRKLVEGVSKIWLEHGALEYREHLGDDMALNGTRSFTDLLAATDSEVIVFGWIAFESREARDLANELVAADRRVEALVSSLGAGFDATKMAYGGFQPLTWIG